MALEELKWGDAAHKWLPAGCLYTCGPGSYKIPSMDDVPLKFSISLLKVNMLTPFSASLGISYCWPKVLINYHLQYLRNCRQGNRRDETAIIPKEAKKELESRDVDRYRRAIYTTNP